VTTLIVNADDFGWSAGINRGIIQAHERGIVTSASLMVRRPAAEEAAWYARSHPALSVGLHVELGHDDEEDEVARQLDAFCVLVGREPTHLDSHHHVHLREPMRTELFALGREASVPVRQLTPRVTFCDSFYGADHVAVDALIDVLESLPEGVTELMCHPAAEVDFESRYGVGRLLELDTLCDPRVRDAIEGLEIELVSFADVAAIT
jgi:predicted glycoside hydrolase/deacetylase ChbG (UPF0249 family)